MTLNWDDPDNSTITKYQYQQAESGGEYDGQWTDIPSSGAQTTSHTVTGLTNGVSYVFAVRAVNTSGPGLASDRARVTPFPIKPAQPTGFSAAAGKAQVTLNWEDPGDFSLTGYQLLQLERIKEAGRLRPRGR